MVFRAPNQPPATAEDWCTPGRFAAVLAILIGASYPGVILGWETFVFRDFGLYGYPVAHYFRACFWRGELPLWNPLNNCGIPFLAQWSTLVLYPLSLFYLVLPLAWSLGVFCLLHLFLAGLGMYFLADYWTGNRLAAGVAGVAFVFNGYVLNCLMWPHCMVVWAWMPWVLYTSARAWQEGGRRILVAAVAGAMQMSGGVPEWILLTWLVNGVMWWGQWRAGRGNRPVLVGRLMLLVLLVAGLMAAQLLPFFDLLRHSQRDTHYATSQWSMPGTGWANLLVPLFGCFRSPSGVFFQANQYFTSSFYPGLGVLVFAVFAGLGLKEQRVRFLAGVMILGLILSLGDAGYLYGAIRQGFPQLGFMRYPIKCFMLASLAMPLLAGFAVRELIRPTSKKVKALWSLGLVFLGLLGWILWFSFRYHAQWESWSVTARNGMGRAVFLVLMLGTVQGMHRVSSSRYRGLLSLALLLLVWLDIETHAPSQNPTVTPLVYKPGLPAFETMAPKPALGGTRAAPSRNAYRKQMDTMLANPHDGILCNRLWLVDNLNLLDNLPKVDGVYSLLLRETDQVVLGFMSASNLASLPLADFMGVSQITDAKKDLEWEPRSTYLPMITAGQQPVFVVSSNALSLVVQPTFAPVKEVYLPMEAKSLVSVTHPTDARILAQRVTAQRVQIEVSASQPSMVVAAMSFYHNWRATIDGQPTRLWRANYAFQALEVPTGRHQVELVYVDWSFRLGAAISILTVVGCGIRWWFRTNIRETD